MSSVYDVAVVGGGAAGLAAAISARRRGARVVICDRMPRLGKKILITGGGRCNLLNDNLSADFFSSADPELVASVFRRYGRDEISAFFKGLGLEVYSESGRIFPVANQASSVLRVLEIEVDRLGVAVELNFEAVRIERRDPPFSVAATDGRLINARSVILASGGKAYPALGSNGSGYKLAAGFGHSIIPPVPSAVPLIVKDRMCHLLQGQKIKAGAAALVAGKTAASAEGEVLFTRYGLSGTAVLDVSEPLSVAINRDGSKDADVVLDLVPFMKRESLAAQFRERMKAGWKDRDLAAGILPDKFATVILAMLTPGRRDEGEAAEAMASRLKSKKLAILGTRGWNEAEFTSGGVDAREVRSQTLESKLQRGLYFAGEILDVQGPRGGFNLAWAWASGLAAGLTE